MVMYTTVKPNVIGALATLWTGLPSNIFVGHTAVEMDLVFVECKPENIRKGTHTTAVNWPLEGIFSAGNVSLCKEQLISVFSNPN